MPTIRQVPYAGPKYGFGEAFAQLAQNLVQKHLMDKELQEKKEWRDVGWAHDDMIRAREQEMQNLREDMLLKAALERQDLVTGRQEARQEMLARKLLQEKKRETEEERKWEEEQWRMKQLGANLSGIFPALIAGKMAEPARGPVASREGMPVPFSQTIQGAGTIPYAGMDWNIKKRTPWMTSPGGQEIESWSDYNTSLTVEQKRRALAGEVDVGDFQSMGGKMISDMLAAERQGITLFALTNNRDPITKEPLAPEVAAEKLREYRERLAEDVTDMGVKATLLYYDKFRKSAWMKKWNSLSKENKRKAIENKNVLAEMQLLGIAMGDLEF